MIIWHESTEELKILPWMPLATRGWTNQFCIWLPGTKYGNAATGVHLCINDGINLGSWNLMNRRLNKCSSEPAVGHTTNIWSDLKVSSFDWINRGSWNLMKGWRWTPIPMYIKSDQENPVQFKTYQPLIGSTRLVQIWWMGGGTNVGHFPWIFPLQFLVGQKDKYPWTILPPNLVSCLNEWHLPYPVLNPYVCLRGMTEGCSLQP